MSAPIKAGVIGWPITQSRSPLIHGSWLKQHNINGSYEKIAVEPHDLEHFIKTLKRNGFAGINLTIPHKETVLAFADEVTKEAKAIGAANTLWFQGDKLIAGNTDAYGFITHLKTSCPTWQKQRPAMILGAGGAARAIIYALMQEGVPEIFLTNRTRERAEKLAIEFNGKSSTSIKVIPWEEKPKALPNCSLLVNSTSLGMTGKPPLQLDCAALPSGAVCYDIVYAPLETQLLKSAKQNDLGTVDGLGMLLHQAVPGFEKWFGVRPAVSPDLHELVVKDLDAVSSVKTS